MKSVLFCVWDFTRNLNVSKNFRQIFQILCFKKIRPTAFELLQTLMTKIIGVFFSFLLQTFLANAPKIGALRIISKILGAV
jgi:hypothetical protein